MRRWIATAVSGLAVVLVLSGCTTSTPPQASSAPASPSATASAPALTGPSTTVAVMGDSLSRGYNACAHFGDCPSMSWAGGTDARVDSVASRLGARLDGPVTVKNVAKSGATVADLAAQVPAAAAADPDLVTVLIGANDVCRASLDDMTSTEDYAATVGGALQQLVALDPGVTILVASVPDVTAILPAAASNPTARFLWSHGGCATVLADPQSRSTEAEVRRAAVADRIREYDAALAGACGALPRCVYDGGALHGYTPTLDQLSALDRFHPSVAGLKELAATEWKVLTTSPRARALLDR
ncbi:SGNH/GDSL hydrolase family protein [Amnibacterium kyonggiense]|uniref:Lysophospholipase L1-like esterase n=1 Tax=Amnibacterium kyonggiense TaxID=595671 RepID=A0A4R7FFL0_9MICO|nr:GDSL-type esterase/lipase family protein [Amnibacterium kyonggiense]TDS74933.1 lysophospholipase L1-like esterase [Amnibacterium kyonggiense]